MDDDGRSIYGAAGRGGRDAVLQVCNVVYLVKHALLVWEAQPGFVALRTVFRQDVVTVLGSMPRRTELLDELVVLLYDQRLTRLVAKYIYYDGGFQ